MPPREEIDAGRGRVGEREGEGGLLAGSLRGVDGDLLFGRRRSLRDRDDILDRRESVVVEGSQLTGSPKSSSESIGTSAADWSGASPVGPLPTVGAGGGLGGGLSGPSMPPTFGTPGS